MSISIKPKVAMIGFDAAEFSYIQAHLPSLPNFRRALSCGIVNRLDSPAELLAGSVWPTFYTASSPGEHGFYHHIQWDAAAMHLRRVSDSWLGCEPFWRKLERRGLRVIALDVPMNFPPRQCGGIEISSWGAHDQLTSFAAFPRELGKEILRRFGKHPIGIEVPVDKPLRERMRIRARLVKGARTKGALTRWLLSSRDWDFFIAVFGESHRGGHILWPDERGAEPSVPPDALLDVYRALDGALGELLSVIKLAETSVIIFSLHGMGDNLSQEHFVSPVMERVNVRFSELEPGLYASGGLRHQRSVMRVLRENVPPWLQSRVANMVSQHMRDTVVDRSYTSGHDWPHTPGIALRADYNGYIRLNLAGREAQGMLQPGSAALARYVDLVRDSFKSLRTADGRRLSGTIYSAPEQFPGRRAHHLPDLIVTWNGLQPASRVESALGTVRGELDTGRGGNHRGQGFQIVLEPGVQQAAQAPPFSIVELAPKILRRFNIGLSRN